jgi:hypothetical protein
MASGRHGKRRSYDTIAGVQAPKNDGWPNQAHSRAREQITNLQSMQDRVELLMIASLA